MSGPNKRKYTTRDTTSPDTHTTVRVVVKEKRLNAILEVEAASVEIVGAGVEGTTNAAGVFAPKNLVRAGKYKIKVDKSHYGPPQTGSTPVAEGTIEKDIELLPNSKLGNASTNEIEVMIMFEHPRIRVTVFEDKGILGGLTPLKDADIEITGLIKGKSDNNGEFVSHYAKFQTWNVHVAKTGMFPQNQDGSAFFRQVELRPLSFAPGRSTLDRDLYLDVVLASQAPADIPPNPGDPITIWASGDGTPHRVLEDPRLAADKAEGQAGWEMGINFANFLALSNALGRARASHLGEKDIGKHNVKKLAIVAHGAPGVVDVDQKEAGSDFGAPTPSGSSSLTAARIGHYNTEIDQIAEALCQNAVVIVASCQAGESRDGEALLKALSKRWKTATIVGLRTIATTVGLQRKKGTNAMYAGVRDTRFANGRKSPERDAEIDAQTNDLSKLPWLAEDSPHATVARDGNIIRRGDPPS
jgi:hypothetical protein